MKRAAAAAARTPLVGVRAPLACRQPCFAQPRRASDGAAAGGGDGDEDPLSMTHVYVDSDPFAPPGVETTRIKVEVPKVFDDFPVTPVRSDPNDPGHWTYEQVIEWIRAHYNDPEIPLDEDLIDAYAMNRTTGKDLMRLYPNNLFKEMRRHYAKKDGYAPKVTEELLRETCLLSFKYGGQDSMW